MGVFDSFQFPYSALQLDYEDIVRQAAAGGAGVIIRGGVAQGSVTISAAEAPTYRQDQVRLQNELWDMAALDELLDGMSRMEFMLRFTLTNPDVTTVVVGTANPDHLADNISAASRGPLPAPLYDEARQRLTAAGEAARAKPERTAKPE
jgi:aryl-alcohol dehydrogenase-like predicted oxidoreductase